MKTIKKLARSDGANAFIPEPGTKKGPAPDDLAEYLGENFVSSATGAEDPDDIVEDGIDVEGLGEALVENDVNATFGSDREEDGATEPRALNSDRTPSVAKRAPSERAIRTLGTVTASSGPKARRVNSKKELS